MDLIAILQFFGITPDKLVPVIIVIVIGIAFYLLFKYTLNPIKQSIRNIDDDLTIINNATTEIQSYFIEAGTRIIHPLTMKPGSPLVLTEYGKKLVKESGFLSSFNKTEIKLLMP